MGKLQESNDTFTEAPGPAVRIINHTADTGETYTEFLITTANFMTIDTTDDNVKVFAFTSGGVMALSSLVPTSADYDAKITVVGAPSLFPLGVIVRAADDDNLYSAGGDNGSSSGQIRKRVASVFTTLASSGSQWDNGDVATLDVAGTSLELLLDAVSDLTATDSSHTAAGSAGFGFGVYVNSAINIIQATIIDDFEVNVDGISHTDTATAVDAGAASTTISSFTVSGADPVLIVKVSSKGSGITHDGVTWNGTEDFTLEATDINGDARTSIWSLASPTATTADVVVTLSGSARHVSAVSLYEGVDQTTPVRPSTPASNNGTDAAPTVDITGMLGDMIVDSLSQVSAGPDTATGDHTERHDTEAVGGGTDTRGASQDIRSDGTTTTMGWTMGDSDNWALCAMALQPPAAPAGFGSLLSGHRNRLILE